MQQSTTRRRLLIQLKFSGEKEKPGFHMLNMSSGPSPFRKHRVLLRSPYPFPTGPKGEHGLPTPPAKADRGQSHLSTHHKQTILHQKGYPFAFQPSSAQARVFVLGPQDGTDRKSLLPLFPPPLPASFWHRAHHWRWTDSEKDCHLLKHPIILPQSYFAPHLPSSYPTS